MKVTRRTGKVECVLSLRHEEEPDMMIIMRPTNLKKRGTNSQTCGARIYTLEEIAATC